MVLYKVATSIDSAGWSEHRFLGRAKRDLKKAESQTGKYYYIYKWNKKTEKWVKVE